MAKFKDLVGKTLDHVDVSHDEVLFVCDDGRQFKLYHLQDCCESVTVEDVCGDITSIIGSPILVAEESTSDTHPSDITNKGCEDSFTWTFYKIDTAKGGVTIRFYGESNGYYSESVDFDEVQA